MRKPKLPVTEELDFHYLLGLMPALKDEPEFAWLPELFSIIGHEKLLDLCKYAGGETIKIPKLDELNECITALQYFYNINIKGTSSELMIPGDIYPLYDKIKAEYNAINN